MEYAWWIYPWDLLDAGPDDVAHEIADSGVRSISVAVSYHAGRLLLPHNPKRRVYLLEDGVVYFATDPSNYAGLTLRPKRAALASAIDPLRVTIDAARRRGLDVHGWAVFCHNSRLGAQHPALTVQNAYGEPYPWALCPSRSEVRAYVLAMAAEVTDRYELAALELEAVGFLGYRHMSHHDKSGVCLDRVRDFLLSVCFCPSCGKVMRRYGVRAEPVARTFRDELDRCLAEPIGPTAETDAAAHERLGAIVGTDVLAALIAARDEVVSSLVQEVRGNVRAGCRLVMRCAGSRLTTGGDAGVDWSLLEGGVDRFLTTIVGKDAAAIHVELNDLRRKTRRPLFAGLEVTWPHIRSDADLAARVDLCRQAGIDGVQFYNYGLVSRATLKAIGKIGAGTGAGL